MVLIEFSTNGYEVIAESDSRALLEDLRDTHNSFELEPVNASYGFSVQDMDSQSVEAAYAYMEEYEPGEEELNLFEHGTSLIIVPRSIIGRREGLSVVEALQEKFPLPSMLLQKLKELNQI